MSSTQYPHKNLLGLESSPYLLQHKDNPVWWYPWGDDAFERARAEEKPVFLSIGYSTCYWCHVMEHDSFEHPEVARVLNEHFVCIKVDREELPDVDQIYMDVVVGIHGHGGWPMSVFLTPDRIPFWGGTFFYRDAFTSLLRGMADLWATDRAKVLTSGGELTRYLNARQPTPGETVIDESVTARGIEQLLKRYDQENGGFGGVPKFPQTQSLSFLLRAHAARPNAAALEVVTATLSSMARGGIFDHLGGGFHRYSVDAEWRIPHFEKMLCDNALLAPLYLEGYLVSGEELLRDVGERTLNYMLNRLTAPGGGFFAAEDAGEVGSEGEFYSWTKQEVLDLVSGETGSRFCELYGVSEQGNFEHGRSVLMVGDRSRWGEVLSPEVRAARERLLARRNERRQPHRDEKVLAGWNGLAISAMCTGYRVLLDERYRVAAVSAAECIDRKMVIGGRLQRRLCHGSVGIDALLEDYAFLIRGYLDLFEISGDSRWLERAVSLQREQDRYLWSGEKRSYLASAAPGLIVKVAEWGDGAIASPNGTALSNLSILAELTGDPSFSMRRELLAQGVPSEAFGIPMIYSTSMGAAVMAMVGVSTCCIVGAQGEGGVPQQVRALWRRFLPFTRVVWRSPGAKTPKLLESRSALGDKLTMYVCRGSTCLPATTDINEAIALCSAGLQDRGV